mmetsp:Transcript_7139/g.16458  ORF Transcript_7139/g.16458 Transcript_7139/m.16458 type:complete len:81 (-) Transcript_7139:244-486(-)
MLNHSVSVNDDSLSCLVAIAGSSSHTSETSLVALVDKAKRGPPSNVDAPHDNNARRVIFGTDSDSIYSRLVQDLTSWSRL